MEQKRGKGIIVLIVFMSFVIVGLAGYIVYDKVLTKKNSNGVSNDIEDKKPESVEVSYDINKATSLVEKYIVTDEISYGSIFEDNYNNSIKHAILIKNISDSDKERMTCKEIYNNEKYSTKINSEDAVCEEAVDTVTYDTANKLYKSLFGEELEKEGMIFGVTGRIAYEEKINKFVSLDCRCGGEDMNYYIHSTKSATEKDNTLKVIVSYKKLEIDSNDVLFTNIDGQKITWTLKESRDDNFDKEFINKYSDKMTDYTFTFEKDIDSNYVLKSVSK